jgi:hypothetical protein
MIKVAKGHVSHGRWFSPGTPASSITKIGHHDIAESGVKHQKSINQYKEIIGLRGRPE